MKKGNGRGDPMRMVVFPCSMPALLKRVLRERAAARDIDMRQVLIQSWLRDDPDALARYEELKREMKGDK